MLCALKWNFPPIEFGTSAQRNQHIYHRWYLRAMDHRVAQLESIFTLILIHLRSYYVQQIDSLYGFVLNKSAQSSPACRCCCVNVLEALSYGITITKQAEIGNEYYVWLHNRMRFCWCCCCSTYQSVSAFDFFFSSLVQIRLVQLIFSFVFFYLFCSYSRVIWLYGIYIKIFVFRVIHSFYYLKNIYMLTYA